MVKEIKRAKSGYLYFKITHHGKIEIIFETQQDLINEIINLLGYELSPAIINDLENCITENNFNLIEETRLNLNEEKYWHEAYNYEPRWDGQD